MNSPDFAGGSACGKSITINYHGKSVQAIVRDEVDHPFSGDACQVLTNS
jgi:hypothetical protein